MTTATVRQCVVAVATPASLLPVGGRPALFWLLRELVRFGVEEAVVLTRGVPNQAVRAVVASLPRPLRLVVSHGPAEPGVALQQARGLLDARFLLCDGQVLFDANLARLLAKSAPDGSGAVGRGALRSTDADGLFIDLGAPDALLLAEELLRRLRRPALFLDRDGVLNADHGWVGTRDRWEWTPTAREAVAHATDQGWHVFIVTNQSGIARGHYDEGQLRALHAWVEDQVHAAGGTVDDWRFAPHHPDATVARYRHPAHPWRKPAPGMLLDLIARWEVDPARSVMIGDQPTDVAAAAAAGVRGVLFEGTDLRAVVERELGRSATGVGTGGG